MKPTLVGIALSALCLIGPVTAQAPSILELGTGCGGVGGTPELSSTTPPMPGGNVSARVRHLAPHANAVLVIGWDAILTPITLDGLGMPGCSLYAYPEFNYPFDTDSGAVDWNLTVPAVPSLVGRSVTSQVFFQQANANAAGVGSSNGLRLTFGSVSTTTQMRSSITQWGITWTFDHSYPAGQFCNGDWWVIGPVQIVSISPGTQTVNGRVINGSMINPNVSGMHGYDSLLYNQGTYATSTRQYSASLNVALNVSTNSPLVLAPSTSLISCISQIGAAASGSASELQTAAVLTVLATVPPADAFRPAYTGNDKTIRYRESQLDYSALADLPPLAGSPSLTATASSFSHVWLDHCAHWTSRYMHPVENMPDYYRNFTSLTGTAGLLLNCNYSDAQKRDLLVGFTQVGIDNYGNIVAGAKWGVNGHCNGRKFPILFAGRVLGDSDMQAVGIQHPAQFYGPDNAANQEVTFSEDGQTFYVQQTSPGILNWGYGGYAPADIGLPEWGNFHAQGNTQGIASDNVLWDANSYRRCCSANGWVGVCLTMQIMGMQPLWNQPAFFAYMDRYTQIEQDGSWTESWIPWHSTMWTAYNLQF
jgi:hypothetical protein